MRPADVRARVAVDLGAESCRVSLLRWDDGGPRIELVHRIANGPVHQAGSLRWPLDTILAGVEEGLRRAHDRAPEGIASIAVDGWAVDYVRLGPGGHPLADPHCYRDERTVVPRERAERLIGPAELFARTGAQPLRINTLYQLLADQASGIDPRTPWICLPEYVLHWLGGRRVAEYTNATHTGLVDIATGGWAEELFELFGLPLEAAPPIVPSGAVVGRLRGPLAGLAGLRETELIAPACHDTASAIAGVATDLTASAAYISSGTWSLVGALVAEPVVTRAALDARFTNQGAAAGGLCFHTNVNGMWLLRQSMESWAREGRSAEIGELVRRASSAVIPGLIDVDRAPLLLDGEMPERINYELGLKGLDRIPDTAGNEPVFARVIFESLAARYGEVLTRLEALLGVRLERIHMLGGGSRNQLLVELTGQRTGIPVVRGQAESSTVGNLAVQLAASGAPGCPLDPGELRSWAQTLSAPAPPDPSLADPTLSADRREPEDRS